MKYKRHGLSRSPMYKRWTQMKSKCYNPNSDMYKYYGGRGIEVCEEWRNDFKAYYDYVMSLPGAMKPGLSIDRIDNDGNYKPGNMRWVNDHVQAANKGMNRNNTSGYKGVRFDKAYGKWRSEIGLNGSVVNLGFFDSKHKAAEARKEYIKENNLLEYNQ